MLDVECDQLFNHRVNIDNTNFSISNVLLNPVV